MTQQNNFPNVDCVSDSSVALTHSECENFLYKAFKCDKSIGGYSFVFGRTHERKTPFLMKTDPHTTAQNVSTKILIDNLVNG